MSVASPVDPKILYNSNTKLLKSIACLAMPLLVLACVNAAEVDAIEVVDKVEPAILEQMKIVSVDTPNVIVILTDDQGYADVGFNGSKDIATPHIDRIANEGVRFDRGYVSFPVCGPSRAGLLTGRYQSRFGYDLNASENPEDPNAGLPLSENMIPAVVKPAGYVSTVIGKWHMGNHPNFHPLERGFDEFFGFTNGGHNYYAEKYRDVDLSKAKSSALLYQTRLVRNRETIDASGYLTDILSDEAVDFVKRKHEEPFFMYLAYNAPHAPLQAPPKYTDRFPHIEDEKRKIYAGMISAVDDGVGRLLDTLDELDIADNTMVFFLSDNGGPQVRAKNGSINLPYRGGKGDLFEGGVRVPYAMRWPAQIPAGIDYPHPVSSLDILATMVAANDIDTSINKQLDGVNLVPYVQDPAFTDMPHDKLFWRYIHNDAKSNWKTAVLIGDDKRVTVKGAEMLYDLEQDKGEQTDIKKRFVSTNQSLADEFADWNENMGKQSVPIWNEWPPKWDGELEEMAK